MERIQKEKDESIMETAIEHFHDELLTRFVPSRYILNTLVGKGLLTSKQVAVIESMPNPELRAENLLWILNLCYGKRKRFSVFVEALNQDYPTLAQQFKTYDPFNKNANKEEVSQRGKSHNGKYHSCEVNELVKVRSIFYKYGIPSG